MTFFAVFHSYCRRKFLKGAPVNLCCAPRAPTVRNLGGTCPRQLSGAGAYEFRATCVPTLTILRTRSFLFFRAFGKQVTE